MRISCGVPGCGQVFASPTDLCVHQSYHQYHDRIKEEGRKEIERLTEKLGVPVCCPLRDRPVVTNHLPQLPTRLTCEWAECEAEFTSAEDFYEHVSNHAHRFVDKCYWSNCNKVIRKITLTLIRDHLRVHTLQKLYACPHCGNFFSTKIKFNDHLLRHMDLADKVTRLNPKVEIYKCTSERCNESFLTPSLLREHERKHSSRNQCDQCHYKAKTASCLESHKLYRHQTERSFECSICPKSFKQRSDLRAHVKRHQIGNPYQCEICDYETFSEDGLVKHAKLHENLSYLCHLCRKTFNRGSNLSRHFRETHELQPAKGSCRFKYKLSSHRMYLVESVDEADVTFPMSESPE